jgi:hypothetical protein
VAGFFSKVLLLMLVAVQRNPNGKEKTYETYGALGDYVGGSGSMILSSKNLEHISVVPLSLPTVATRLFFGSPTRKEPISPHCSSLPAKYTVIVYYWDLDSFD